MAKEEANEEQAEEKKKGGSSTMKIVIIAVVLSILLGGGLVGGTIYFLGGNHSTPAAAGGEAKDENAEEGDTEEAEAAPEGPVEYTAIDPKFVVSFNDQHKARFMQFSLQIMTRQEAVLKDIATHMPAVRSNLLMLIGSQSYETVITREGKEKLLADITADINRTLETLGGTSGVEAAYFDSFVIQ